MQQSQFVSKNQSETFTENKILDDSVIDSINITQLFADALLLGTY